MDKQTLQNMFDIAITAAEGGIGYWSQVSGYRCGRMDGPDRGVWFRLHEGASEEEASGKSWEVDAELVKSGCEQAIRTGFGKELKGACALALLGDEEVSGDIDAPMADCILQYAVFGEVVYG